MDHITDDHLRRRLTASLTSDRCDFCTRMDRSRPVAVDLGTLVRSVMAAVREAYEQTAGPDQGIPTSVAVEEICHRAIDAAVTRAVADCTERAGWRSRGFSRPGTTGEVTFVPWSAFRERVRHQRRFTLLSGTDHDEQPPVDMLDVVSAVIEKLGRVRTLPAGHRVWRGRMRADTTRPGFVAATIGSTPRTRATANRLSPAGVSMFYGSADVDTVVAEISAHDVRPYAAVAAFELTRPVAVIDLSAVPEPPSVFDPDWRSLVHPVAFIRSFSEDLSRPVVLDGREHTEYVPTQVLTEYFRWLSPLRVEGIVFRSAQNGGINYVLFTGPEGCVDEHADQPGAMLRLRPHTELVVERAPSKQHV
ncbi:RES domain-containing protein [Streptomyces sp. NPDC015127]|uniref:RES domain-containing protein n=1 Tax=Streptomyces sp. NPDC015127 TaxID=3364939 RepID=UPI0036FE8BFC